MAAEHDGHPAHLLDADWNRLVKRWAAGTGLAVHDEATHVSLSVARRPAVAEDLHVYLTTSSRFLVAFITNGRTLGPGELARAAAAANAWNIEQLMPTLSVWNVRGRQPHLAGVCTLPLLCRMTQPDFDDTASSWVDQASTMFARCREVFRL
ncbi:hypothetical protein [Streptomyces sp. GbtcB6]|uniref:hypothetical protein n=1 Tax=Streptomyces sp. GbtcB6 TaxID=2824751 RepID=UPI001C2F444D|nr:hypothetical protein [Streptomyces sp. GbtcB6]